SSDVTHGDDPRKFKTIKLCLEPSFTDVALDESNRRFVCTDGKLRSELIFARVFLDDIHIQQLAWLKAYMTMKIIHALKANPGKKISVTNSGITISEIGPV